MAIPCNGPLSGRLEQFHTDLRWPGGAKTSRGRCAGTFDRGIPIMPPDNSQRHYSSMVRH